MASLCTATTLLLIFNILFFGLTHGQQKTANPPAPSPTSAPPPGLDCSGCRVNPIGLASCGAVFSGFPAPSLIRLCCKTLQELSTDEGLACLCNAINRNMLKIGDLDIPTAANQVLAACSK